MNIPDHISESLETIFLVKKILEFFDADPDPGAGIFLTLDPGPGMEKFKSGIRGKHHGCHRRSIFSDFLLLMHVSASEQHVHGRYPVTDLLGRLPVCKMCPFCTEES
jgi:hypothetical protein